VTSLGPGEGVLRLIVMPGPVQNGNVNPQADWVTPFSKHAGCRVDLTNASSDAQAESYIAGGGAAYDGILASPEVAGQLIAARAVAPLNVGLISGYGALSPKLRSAPSQVSGGRVYGVPYIWDSYVAGYNSGQVKPTPQDWSAVFAPPSAARYAGKITLPDSTATIALAALYLKSARPSLGISDPFELDKTQFAAAVQAVNAVRRSVSTFWTQDSSVVGQLGDGQDALGGVMNHQISEMARAGLPVAGVPALAGAGRSGVTAAYVESWLMSAKAAHPSCMYRWLSWSASRYVQEQASAWTGDAPVNPAACTGPVSGTCDRFNEAGLASARNVVFEHLPVSDCGDGRAGCVAYGQWQAAWQRIVSGSPGGRPPGTPRLLALAGVRHTGRSPGLKARTRKR
jgi:putative spermidine/putrescine transport system substrate-binding protein